MSGAHAHEPVHPRIYFIVYGALLFFMVLTIVVYKMELSPVLGIVVAMAIAVIKAVLVILFFMQVAYSSKLTWLWAALGFVWLFLMTGIIIDYVSRFYLMPGGRKF